MQNCENLKSIQQNNCSNKPPLNCYYYPQQQQMPSSGVNIVIYNPAVMPGNGTNYNGCALGSSATDNSQMQMIPQQQSCPINSTQQTCCYPPNYYTYQPKTSYKNIVPDNAYKNLDNNIQSKKQPSNTTLQNDNNINTADSKQTLEELDESDELDELDNDIDNLYEKEEAEDELIDKNKGNFSNNTAISTPLKTKKIVQITDDYVKTIENYLKSSKHEVRLMGAKNLIDRFKEDKTRYNDIALNNLVNIMLQDQSDDIRFMALCSLYANDVAGTDFTFELLNNMRKSNKVHGDDARIASEILLKRSQEQVQVKEEVNSI